MKQIAWIILGWLFLLTSGHAASFDCGKAATKVEKIVCGDDYLSKTDESLNATFRHYFERSEDKRRAKNEQNEWLKSVRNICQDKDCLGEAYQKQISYLSTTQNETTGLYLFRCDKNNSQLTIIESVLADEHIFSNPEDMAGDSILNPYDLIKYVQGADCSSCAFDDDTYVETLRNSHYQCSLKSATYKIDVYPNVFNSHVNGRCGAAPPTLAISITRNGKLIVNKLPLIRDCMVDQVIDAIRLDENNGSIKLYSNLKEHNLHKEKTFSIASIRDGFDSALFDDTKSSGNPTLDLQHGVESHDFDLVSRSLDNGADINFHEESSLGVFCNIATGRSKAVDENRAAEFDQETDKLVDLLISRGASPKFTSPYGRTFVDCSGYLPTRTLRKLLVLGWPNDYDFWMYAGAQGNSDILKEAIEHGADPNKPVRENVRLLDVAISTPRGYSQKGQEAVQKIGLEAMEILLKAGAKLDDGTRFGGDILHTFSDFGERQNIQPVLELLIKYSSPDARKNILNSLNRFKSNMAANHQAIDQDKQNNLDWLLNRLSQ